MLVAVDTGGTKTLITQFGEDGKIGEILRFPTPSDQDEYVTLLRSTLEEQYAATPVEAIVVALPGIIKDGVALWCNSLDALNALNGVLGETPIIIENDANLAGLAETRALNPVPTSSLYVTISTGIGTGVITNGTIDPGLRYSEGGRMLVEFEGKVREWESFASGKAIHHTYKKYARDITDRAIWDQISDRISRGFLAIIPFAQPDVIIIGGSVGTYFERFASQLEAILQEKLPPHIACPRFLPANHPEEAVIYGCYYYALDHFALA
jgi:predicted NBD/HSP70 family sugar kinase